MKLLGTLFIARKSGTDLRTHFSDRESENSRQTSIPIHRPLDIHDGHISMDTVSNTGYRQWSKVLDTRSGRNAGGRVPCTCRYTLGP